MGLAIGSKGTAVGIIPGIILHITIVNIAQKRGERRGVSWQLILMPMVAALTFLVTWPWLWQNPIKRISWVIDFHERHAKKGHLTFYAGKVYRYVPFWVPTYILLVKTPTLSFVLSLLSVVSVIAKLAKNRHIDEGQINAISWLIGGLLAMSTFSLIIGDHYIVFLHPASLISATIFARNVPNLIKGLNASPLKKIELSNALLSLMVLECLIGLLAHAPSPCGYASELVVQADEALLMIDTGFEGAAEYLINHAERGSTVAVAYSTKLLTIELQRKHEDHASLFRIAGLKELGSAKYAVFPSIYVQRWGMRAPENWITVHVIRSGESVLCYILRNPSKI